MRAQARARRPLRARSARRETPPRHGLSLPFLPTLYCRKKLKPLRAKSASSALYGFDHSERGQTERVGVRTTTEGRGKTDDGAEPASKAAAIVMTAVSEIVEVTKAIDGALESYVCLVASSSAPIRRQPGPL